MKYPAYMKKIRGAAFIFLALWMTSLSSCRKNPDANFILTGVISDAGNGNGLQDAHVRIEQQILSGGVFNADYAEAASMRTASDGTYLLFWKRETSASFRFTIERNSYIRKEIELNPDEFIPSEPVSKNYSIHPEAFVRVKIENEGAGEASDLARFTFTNTNFDCACCQSQWYELAGAETDSTWKCRLYGNTWLKYRTEISTTDGFSIDFDSIWCPAFDTTYLDIQY